MLTRREVGDQGESLVQAYYEKQGYELVCKNFEYRISVHRGRLGEVDLIFKKGQILYFVEVKTRNNERFGKVQEQVGYKKMNLIYNCYRYFVSKTEYQQFKNFFFQFDLALIFGSTLKIVPNAFQFDKYSK